MSDVKALNGHSNVTKKPLMVTASSATISKPENELGVQAEQCTSWKWNFCKPGTYVNWVLALKLLFGSWLWSFYFQIGSSLISKLEIVVLVTNHSACGRCHQDWLQLPANCNHKPSAQALGWYALMPLVPWVRLNIECKQLPLQYIIHTYIHLKISSFSPVIATFLLLFMFIWRRELPHSIHSLTSCDHTGDQRATGITQDLEEISASNFDFVSQMTTRQRESTLLNQWPTPKA